MHTILQRHGITSWLINTLFLLLVFVAVYTIHPTLYSSNQNTYLLHGLAQAGMGFLSADWLVQTTDPMPLFTQLVKLTYLHLGESAFYVYHMVLLGVYIYAMVGIARRIFAVDKHLLSYLIYVVLLLLLHSAVLNILSHQLTGIHVGWLFYFGVADQYILGSIFQPSLFGVFLIFSIYAFISQRPWLAIASATFAAIIHPTYLLTAATLTATYMGIIYYQSRQLRPAFLLGVMSLIIVLPIVIYVWQNFTATSAEIMQQSRHILVDLRIPHHVDPERWLHKKAWLQIGIVIISLVVIRKTRLFPIMLSLFVVTSSLTLLQFATAHKGLALLFPWRMFALLVPIASCMIIAAIVQFIFNRYQSCIEYWKKVILIAVPVIIFALAIPNIVFFHNKTTAPTFFEYVKAHKTANDLYLVPKHLQQFRLATGAPVVIDEKSHPYKDNEVIEWYTRFTAIQAFYQAENSDNACQQLDKLVHTYQISHVVFSQENVKTCPSLETVYQDEAFSLMKIN